MKSDRPSPLQNRETPQFRPIEPRKPLSRDQHLIMGFAMILMLIVLLVLAWAVRLWQADTTRDTSFSELPATEPSTVEMADEDIRAALSPDALSRDGRIVVGCSEAVRRINPLFATGNGEHDAVSLIFESLIQLDPDQKTRFDLAESFDFDVDSHQVSFVIRSDHFFRDGRAVEARDVAYTYRLLLAKSYDGHLKGHFSAIEAVEADPDDPQRVIFQLSEWVREPDMTWFTVGILKFDANPVDLDSVYELGQDTPPPDGSGPFELSELNEEHTTLVLRPGFAGEISEINFRLIDPAEKYALLKAGEIDITYNVWDVRLKERLDSLQAYTWQTFESTSAYVLINRGAGSSPLFQSVEQQNAVLAVLARRDGASGDEDVLMEMANEGLTCLFYRGIDETGLKENQILAEKAMSPLTELGIPVDMIAVDWPDLASKALEGGFDLMVIPTPANERLPANTVLLDRAETGAGLSGANAIAAATRTEAILVSRRFTQISLNPHSHPLAVSPLSWTDRIENMRYLTKGA